MTQLLQRLVVPRDGCPEPLLYVRTGDGARLADGELVLAAGGTATFDTSFAAFAAGRWRRLTSVGALSLVVDGTGAAVAGTVGTTVAAVDPVYLAGITPDTSSATQSVPGR